MKPYSEVTPHSQIMLTFKRLKPLLVVLPFLLLTACDEETSNGPSGPTPVLAANGSYYPEGTLLDVNGLPADTSLQALALTQSPNGLIYPPYTLFDANGDPTDSSIAPLNYTLGPDGFLYPSGTEFATDGTPLTDVSPVGTISTNPGNSGGNAVDIDGNPIEDSCPLMCEVEVVTQETVEVEGVGCTADPYLAGEPYAGGATVSFEGKTYTSRWWTNYSPTSAPDGAWGEGVPCGGSGLVTRPVVSTEMVCCESIVEEDEELVPEFDCILDKHLTRATFNSWFSGRAASQYDTFYTYDNLCSALDTFSDFANTGDDAADKREIAAFFANVARETGELQYIEEISQTVPTYYGRGPIQLTHNYNYEAAGTYIGSDLLTSPGLVSSDGVISWKTGLWFWMAASGAGKGTCHEAIHSGGGLGKTIDIINGGYECRGPTPAAQERITYFERYISDLGVDAGGPKTCW